MEEGQVFSAPASAPAPGPSREEEGESPQEEIENHKPFLLTSCGS